MTRANKRMKESVSNSVSEDEVLTYWMTVKQSENFKN